MHIVKFLKALSSKGQRTRRKGTNPEPPFQERISLPVDILRLIFELTLVQNPYARLSRKRYQADGALKLSSLAKVALVCRSWYNVAAPLLYANCIIVSPASLELLWRTMESSQTPLVTGSFAYAPTYFDDKARAKAGLVFKICRKLSKDISLDISIFAANSFLLKRKMSGDVADSLVSLVLRGNLVNSNDGSEFCTTVTFPNLVRLVVDSFMFEDEFRWPSMPALEELCLDGCQFEGRGGNSQVLSAFTTIKKLDIRYTFVYPPLESGLFSSFFAACAPSLQHLSLMGGVRDRTSYIMDWVHLLTNLRSFSYGFGTYESVYSMDPLEEVEMIFCLEFSPGVPSRESFIPALNASPVNLSVRSFLDKYNSSMGVMGLRLYGFRHAFGHSDELRRRCEAMGIELDTSGCVFNSDYKYIN